MSANTNNTCLVYATKDPSAKHVQVFRASLEAYVPIPIFCAVDIGDFGYSYNCSHHDAVDDGYEYVIHCNDDVVFRPDTVDYLLNDANHLTHLEVNWGWLAARTDWVRHSPQNIRYPYDNAKLDAIGYAQEGAIVEVDMISPICAIIRADRFMDYAEINWFSDDEQCYRMKQAGYRHFVSSAYVHHVGSQTMTPETWAAEQVASVEYLQEHNPEFLKAYGIK